MPSALKGLQDLILDLVSDGVTSREEFHEWKRSHSSQLMQYLDYNKKDDMPDVTQIVAPHFHPTAPLIGLNYTPAAGVSLHHREGGWSKTLRLCRGITFDHDARLVAYPFPKFFNWGEINGGWGEGEPEVTVKEDGHLLIMARYGDAILVKTRGDFDSNTARIGKTAVVESGLRERWMEMDLRDVTVLCELIHPETKVTVEQGERRAMVLIGVYDNETMVDLPHSELSDAADALGIEVVRRMDMDRETLVSIPDSMGGGNSEGVVATWPDGHRVKFKYASYIAKNKEERAQRQAPPKSLAGGWKTSRAGGTAEGSTVA